MVTVKPLSARSVIISLLLGAHPRGMSARELVRAGEHFGVPDATVRVALTRAVANDELVREDSAYQIGPGLVARSERRARPAVLEPWTGDWEMVVVVTTGRPSSERAALRQSLSTARLAELREGVWMRPANLDRPLPRVEPDLHTFTATPREKSVTLAATLWDLDGWAGEAATTVESLSAGTDPAERLAVAAHLNRHLATDPLLPRELWPAGWPGPRAREVYADFEEEVQHVIDPGD